jgi:hypothetical protein
MKTAVGWTQKSLPYILSLLFYIRNKFLGFLWVQKPCTLKRVFDGSSVFLITGTLFLLLHAVRTQEQESEHFKNLVSYNEKVFYCSPYTFPHSTIIQIQNSKIVIQHPSKL